MMGLVTCDGVAEFGLLCFENVHAQSTRSGKGWLLLARLSHALSLMTAA